MITAQSQLGEVTAQSGRGYSSVKARSQLSHGEVTAQSRHLQYDRGSVTARSNLNQGPGHGSVTAGCDHFGHRELTVSSRWAHGELTVSSQWAVTVAIFFLMGQSSGAITRSNIISYCINNCRNPGRISIKGWIHKRHVIPRVFFVNICEKVELVLTAPHCNSMAIKI